MLYFSAKYGSIRIKITALSAVAHLIRNLRMLTVTLLSHLWGINKLWADKRPHIKYLRGSITELFDCFIRQVNINSHVLVWDMQRMSSASPTSELAGRKKWFLCSKTLYDTKLLILLLFTSLGKGKGRIRRTSKVKISKADYTLNRLHKPCNVTK